MKIQTKLLFAFLTSIMVTLGEISYINYEILSYMLSALTGSLFSIWAVSLIGKIQLDRHIEIIEKTENDKKENL